MLDHGVDASKIGFRMLRAERAASKFGFQMLRRAGRCEHVGFEMLRTERVASKFGSKVSARELGGRGGTFEIRSTLVSARTA